MDWSRALGEDVPVRDETCDLALHLFTRYLWKVKDVPVSTRPKRGSRGTSQYLTDLAACLWLAIKLEELQVTVPCTKMMGKATRIPAKNIHAAEARVGNALEWNLLNGWVPELGVIESSFEE